MMVVIVYFRINTDFSFHLNDTVMYVGEKKHVHPRSFHHRIRDGAGSFFNSNHFLGMDPMDHSRFQGLYGDKTQKKKVVLVEEDTHHLISNL